MISHSEVITITWILKISLYTNNGYKIDLLYVSDIHLLNNSLKTM